MKSERLNCEQANKIDMVDFLQKLGFMPKKINSTDYWYLSPLREEKTASFKINRAMNLWYDHGLGKGGTLIDFGILYYRCSIKELLERLGDEKELLFSFQQPEKLVAVEKKELKHEGKISIIDIREIRDPSLRSYLHERQIPLAIANQYCHEVCFELYNKRHLAIGFKNESGGYELRNQYFKGSSKPKEPRLIKENKCNDLTVFEGFFSFLSFQTIRQTGNQSLVDLNNINADSLILNSVSFFEKSREKMDQYTNIYLFLDHDKRGIACTKHALSWDRKYQDLSLCYNQFKDLNEYLVKTLGTDLKAVKRRGMSL